MGMKILRWRFEFFITEGIYMRSSFTSDCVQKNGKLFGNFILYFIHRVIILNIGNMPRKRTGRK